MAEVKESLGLTDRKANALAGELEESKALLEAGIRGQRQVEQELQDTRDQVYNTFQLYVVAVGRLACICNQR